MLLVEHLTIEIKDKSCLSYFYVRLVQCFTDQVQFIDYLLDVVKAGNKEWESVHGHNKDVCPIKPKLPPIEQLVRKRREIKEVFSFAKHHMVGHLTTAKHDPCRFHCVNHALGGCGEEHPEDCFECGNCTDSAKTSEGFIKSGVTCCAARTKTTCHLSESLR